MKVEQLSSKHIISKLKNGTLIVFFIALLTQILSIYLLINHTLPNALFFHILSAFIFPWPLWKLLPLRFHRERKIVILFFLICLLIPLVSGIGLLLSLSINSHFSKPFLGELSNTIKAPTLPEHLLQTMQLSSYKGESLLGVLEASTVENQRIKAVLKTRQMLDKEAIPILKVALLDPVDEVRLLAYSMLDKKEKILGRQITTQLEALKDKPSEKHIAEHMSLAEAYWELSYLGLVHGQAQIHILQDAYTHIQKVVMHRTTDADAYFLQARITLALNLYDIAEDSLDHVVELDLNTKRTNSYQKELAFITRHFEGINEKKTHKNNSDMIVNQIEGVTETWG
jgi:hypothetical protein